MPWNCQHALTDILDTSESVEDDEALITRTEVCRMCGYRRTLTERAGRVSEGLWERFRFRITL